MWNRRQWSVEPCTLLSPRRAFTPPPATPMFPSMSWMMAMFLIICVPTVCWVQPMAYMMVADFSGPPVEA